MEKHPSYQIKDTDVLKDLPIIKGPTLRSGMSFSDYLDTLGTTGMQASELSHAIEIGKMMVREQVPIFLSFTSNMISSGIREVIASLVREKKVAVISTSAGGIEEDIIKSIQPFHLGSFIANGEILLDSGITRYGNVYATTAHYAYFEKFMQDVFTELYETQQKIGIPCTPSDIARLMGKKVAQKKHKYQESYLYWAQKHEIPVYCPGIVDGSIGDLLYFFKQNHKDFVVDVSLDHKRIIDYVLSCEKTAGIIIGGGIAKHYILNANIFKEGFDYTVYITTADSYDGSDSGANPDEAISWAKIKANSPRMKVICDATIAFPIFAYGVFFE